MTPINAPGALGSGRWFKAARRGGLDDSFLYSCRYAKSAINLILGFDGILPDELNGLVAQRIQLLEGG